MNRFQDAYEYFLNRLDGKFKFCIYKDIVAEYLYKKFVIDIFIKPINVEISDFNYLKKVINQFEEDYKTKIVNGLFAFKNKSVQIYNASEFISLIVCGHDETADGIFENFRYQISKSEYNDMITETLDIDIEDYIYKESSGLAQARKVVYSNMLNIKHISLETFVKGCQYYVYTGFLYLADISGKKYGDFDILLSQISDNYKMNEEMKAFAEYDNSEMIYDATINILTKLMQLIQDIWKMKARNGKDG